MINKEQKEKLENKRYQLQLKLNVAERWKKLEAAWNDYFVKFTDHNIPFRIVYAECVQQEDLPYWKEVVQHKNSSIPFDIDHFILSDHYPIHEKAYKIFGDTNPVRYVPDLPVKAQYEEDANKIIAEAIAELDLTDDTIYYFLSRFPIALEINLSTVQQFAAQIFDMPIGEDIILVSKDFNWMIFRSLENEWRYGLKRKAPAL